MTTARRYSPYTIVLGYATAQTLDVQQLTSVDYNPGTDVTQFHSAGSIDPNVNIVTKIEPEFDIASGDIATILASVVSFTGGKLLDEASNIYFAQREEAGTSTVHYKYTVPRSFIYVDQISADGTDQLAEARLKLCVLDDDSADPVTRAGSVDLAAIAVPAFNGAFFNGGVFENSTEIEGVLGQTWNPGLTVTKNYRTSSSCPHTCAITERNPEFRFRVAEMSETDLNDIQGRLLDTSMAFYLQKSDTTLATTEARIAKATAGHIKASFTAGAVHTESVRGDGNNDVMTEVIVRPTGTVSFSAASAIA